ncbi:Ribonuclease H [Eumeta japonica]|uniref:Ribonuclease H n=1 Tax=Eumeta variegata TaxID=151549 RepID=A0A4C1YUB4_EUMVA|nr:Ribonuclease H [Eumeta japonica]
MFALHRAIKRVKKGKDRLVNIFSDSKSSLQMLTGPTTYNPLAHAARRDILDIVAEGRGVRLFWVRAHAGTAGNERADELARNAALKKRRRQRTMIVFRCRSPKRRLGRRVWTSGKRDTPREALVI